VRVLEVRRFARIVLTLAAAAVTLLVPGVAAGHGASSLNVYPPVAAAGDEISVYATMLWTDQPVVVSLLAIDGTQWVLGHSTTDGNGSFSTLVRVPDDLPDATYSVLARADNGEDAHARLDLVTPPGSVPLLPVVAAAVAVIAVVLFVVAVVLRRRRRIDPDA